MDAAAKSVHAQVMDPEGKVLRKDGDLQLRRSYSNNMQRLMQQASSRPVQQIVDLGCATGKAALSSLEQHCPAAILPSVHNEGISLAYSGPWQVLPCAVRITDRGRTIIRLGSIEPAVLVLLEIIHY